MPKEDKPEEEVNPKIRGEVQAQPPPLILVPHNIVTEVVLNHPEVTQVSETTLQEEEVVILVLKV